MLDDVHSEQQVGTHCILPAPTSQRGGVASEHHIRPLPHRSSNSSDGLGSLRVDVNIDHPSDATPFGCQAEESVTAAIVNHCHLCRSLWGGIEHALQAAAVDEHVVVDSRQETQNVTPAVVAQRERAVVEGFQYDSKLVHRYKKKAAPHARSGFSIRILRESIR